MDLDYFDLLEPTSIMALDHYLAQTSDSTELDVLTARMRRAELANDFLRRDRDWRLWSFRDWRLEQYLAGVGDFAIAPPADRTEGTVTMPGPERPDTATMP